MGGWNVVGPWGRNYCLLGLLYTLPTQPVSICVLTGLVAVPVGVHDLITTQPAERACLIDVLQRCPEILIFPDIDEAADICLLKPNMGEHKLSLLFNILQVCYGSSYRNSDFKPWELPDQPRVSIEMAAVTQGGCLRAWTNK